MTRPEPAGGIVERVPTRWHPRIAGMPALVAGVHLLLARLQWEDVDGSGHDCE